MSLPGLNPAKQEYGQPFLNVLCLRKSAFPHIFLTKLHKIKIADDINHRQSIINQP
jgi:hypothetical protein